MACPSNDRLPPLPKSPSKLIALMPPVVPSFIQLMARNFAAPPLTEMDRYGLSSNAPHTSVDASSATAGAGAPLRPSVKTINITGLIIFRRYFFITHPLYSSRKCRSNDEPWIAVWHPALQHVP